MTGEKNRQECFFCPETNPHALEEHHIVPERFDGSDEPENMVWLCGSCHNKIEQLYDDRFYKRLGIDVEELQREPLERSVGGVEVDATMSEDREIPPQSAHIRVEQPWIKRVTITEIQSQDFDDNFAEFVDRHENRIMAEYASVRESQRPVEYYKDDLPKWVMDDGHKPVTFHYEHDEQATFPVLKVTNPEKNRYDQELRAEMQREKWESQSDESDEINTKEVESESDARNRVAEKHYNKQMKNGWWESPQSYGEYYRLHCGYCHTAFAQYQHSDAARHLRMRHGVENPYEKGDTHFAEPKRDAGILSHLDMGDSE